jgi:hypothetical protein
MVKDSLAFGNETAKPQSEWYRFFRIVSLGGLLPLAFVTILVVTFAWSLGEALPSSELILKQRASNKLLFQSGINFDRGEYKLLLAEAEKADILFLGTSRAGQWRSAMFTPYSFVNAGFATWTFKEYREFVERLPLKPDYSPRILMFNLDFFMFGRSYASQYGNISQSFGSKQHVNLLKIADSAIGVAEYVIGHPSIVTKGKIDPYTGANLSGILCISTLNCYRKDGSMRYGASFRDEASRSAPFPRIDLDENYRRDAHPWIYASEIDSEQKHEFELFVSAAKKRGIILVGVQIPYYKTVLENVGNQNDFGIITKFFSSEMKSYFNSLDIIYFDFSRFFDHPEIVSNRKFWLDAFHPTEAVDTQVLIEMLQYEPFRRLVPLLNANRLSEKLNQPKTAAQHPFDLWNNEF